MNWWSAPLRWAISALAITDECSLAGVVKAHVAAKELGIQLIIGSELNLEEGISCLRWCPPAPPTASCRA